MRKAIFSTAALLLIGCADEMVPPADVADITAEPVQTEDTNATRETESATEDPVTEKPTSYNALNEMEQYVLLNKGTERAFTGEYTDIEDPGTYICRQCNAQLYQSDHKFHSNCGWPAFDDEIPGAVTHRPETDGTGRTEIVCSNCDGHLGHVFAGEGFTSKNTRHCVNSVSMVFIHKGEDIPEKIVLEK